VLYCKLSLPTISIAFLEAFSIAPILALCSDARLFNSAIQRLEVMYNS
jgi:hypothetical protein